MLVLFESPSAVLIKASLKSMSICNRFHARRANSGKITTFRDYPSLMPAVAGFLEERLATWTVEIYV